MPRTRAAALLAALALAGPALVPPLAAGHPTFAPADVRRHVTVTGMTYLLGKDRVFYQLRFTASVSVGPGTVEHSYAFVDVARCARGTCPEPVRYLAELTPGDIDLRDPERVVVTLRAFGGTFTLYWNGAGPTRDDATTPAVADGPAVELVTPWPVWALFRVLGGHCRGIGVAAARRTTVYPRGYAKPTGYPPLPAGRTAALPASGTCRGEPR